MTGIQVGAVAGAVWLAAGLATILWMARRGHRDPLWLLMAVVFGPFLALMAAERIERTPRLVHADQADDFPTDSTRVLVGIDESLESHAALHAVLRLFDEKSAIVIVLATVVDFDAADIDWRGRQHAAHELLAAARRTVGDRAVTCEVLAGRPGPALLRCARRHHADLVAIGRNGRGLSVRILGSVAEELARKAPFPVLIVGPDASLASHEPVLARRPTESQVEAP